MTADVTGHTPPLPGGPAGAGEVPVLLGGPPARRCLVMGVVSVTPDSFSDVGKAFHPEQAIAHGMELLSLGADLIEVGGESTRPGATLVPLAEDRRRVLPVVRALTEAGGFVSIATVRARLAEAAIEAGAAMVTDMSGGLADPAMLPLLAGYEVPYVLMHWWGHASTGHPSTGHPSTGHPSPRAADRTVVAEVMAELANRAAAATAAGIAAERLILDPGLGLARTDEDNWQLLAHLGSFRQLGRPVLVGPLRTSFPARALASMGRPEVTAGPGWGRPEDTAGKRGGAAAAIAVLAAAAGAWGVRSHDTRTVIDAVRVVTAVHDRSGPLPPAGTASVHVQ